MAVLSARIRVGFAQVMSGYSQATKPPNPPEGESAVSGIGHRIHTRKEKPPNIRDCMARECDNAGKHGTAATGPREVSGMLLKYTFNT